MSLYAVRLTDGAQFDVALGPDGHAWNADVAGHRFQLRLLGACQRDGILLEIDGRRVCLSFDQSSLEAFQRNVQSVQVKLPCQPKHAKKAVSADTSYKINSPIAGIVLSALVTPGQAVKRGDALFVVEAMKMENVVCASRDGVVATLHCAEGEIIRKGQLMSEVVGVLCSEAAPPQTEAVPPRTEAASTHRPSMRATRYALGMHGALTSALPV